MAESATDVHATDAQPLRRRSWWQVLLADRAADSALIERLWNNADAVIADGRPLKPGDRCTIVRVDHLGEAYVLKRFNRRGPLHTALHLPLRSRARWCWSSARLLRGAGINTPRPLVMLETRFGPLRDRSFLLSAFVEGRVLADIIDDDPDAEELESIAAHVGSIWRTLGDLHVGHRDMKATNFMVDDHGAVWLVDLDAMRRYPPGPWFALRRRKDLRRFLNNWPDRPHVQETFRRAMQHD